MKLHEELKQNEGKLPATHQNVKMGGVSKEEIEEIIKEGETQ